MSNVPSKPAGTAPRRLFPLPTPVQWALCVLVVILTVVLVVQSWATTKPQAEAEPLLMQPLDLNQASRQELRLLPGVGDKLAERIVEYRRLRGGFRNVEELRSVAGIGPVTLARLRNWVTVGDDPIPATNGSSAMSVAADVGEPAPKMARAKSKVDEAAGKIINVNHANADELRQLPGIGPTLSQRIIETRNEKGPFQSAEDLRRVKGIGKKTVEKIKPYVAF